MPPENLHRPSPRVDVTPEVIGMPLRYEEILARRYSGMAIRLTVCDLLWIHRFIRKQFKSKHLACKKIQECIDFSRWLRVFAPRSPCRVYSLDKLKRTVYLFVGRLWDLDTLASTADGKLGFWEIFNLLPFEVFCFELAEVVHNACVDLGAYCSPEKVRFEDAAERWAESMGCEELKEEPRRARILSEWAGQLRVTDKVFEPKRLSRIDRVLLYSYFLGLPTRFQANSERLRIQRLNLERKRFEVARVEVNSTPPAHIAQRLRRDLWSGQRRRAIRMRKSQRPAPGLLAHNNS